MKGLTITSGKKWNRVIVVQMDWKGRVEQKPQLQIKYGRMMIKFPKLANTMLRQSRKTCARELIPEVGLQNLVLKDPWQVHRMLSPATVAGELSRLEVVMRMMSPMKREPEQRR